MERIAIIGAGRMGSLLARKFSRKYKILVHDQNDKLAHQVALSVGGLAVELAGTTEAEAIILALPTTAVLPVVRSLTGLIGPEHILINVATTMPKREIEETVSNASQVVSAKIIGHAMEIEAGEKPVVVIDSQSPASGEKAAQIFGLLGSTLQGTEATVELLNTIASAEGIKAALRIRKKMRQNGLPAQLFEVAVRNVAAGTMKAFASGDVGPFAQKIVEQFEKELN